MPSRLQRHTRTPPPCKQPQGACDRGRRRREISKERIEVCLVAVAQGFDVGTQHATLITGGIEMAVGVSFEASEGGVEMEVEMEEIARAGSDALLVAGD